MIIIPNLGPTTKPSDSKKKKKKKKKKEGESLPKNELCRSG